MALNSLLPVTTITAAGTVLSQTFDLKANGQKLPLSIACQGKFVYGSGGTAVNVFIQTSFDGGVTWCDVIQFNFLQVTANKFGSVNRQTAVVPVAPTDGSLASNTKNDGIVGPLWRAKVVSTGTYAGGTTLQLDLSGEN